MFNNDGIRKTELGSRKQILANVEMQASVGCVIDDALGTTIDGKKIVKAGTPLVVDLSNRLAPATLANGTSAMNAVLLHDVEVTNGDGNATALIFGFVNAERLDADVLTLVDTAKGNASASKLLVFLKG